MADIKISLDNIQNTKLVEIEGVGSFKVRKLGAGEELDLSDKLRRLSAIITELSSIDFTKYDATKKKDLKELEKVNKKASLYMNEINDIKRFEYDTYKRCFDDMKGGKDTEKLFNILDDEGRTKLFTAIFNPTVINEPESPEKADE